MAHALRRAATAPRAGLVGLAIDALAISTAAAGVRRVSGISAKVFVESMVKNPNARRGLGMYFAAGERVLDWGLTAMRTDRVQNAIRKAQENQVIDADEDSSSSSSSSKRSRRRRAADEDWDDVDDNDGDYRNSRGSSRRHRD